MAESKQVRDSQVVASDDRTASTSAATPCEAGNNGGDVHHKDAPLPTDVTTTSELADAPIIVPEISTVILDRLARQVEYYFSTANLAKDTYVATLRSLNDGYVPVSIIANFAKVKALVPYDSHSGVLRAATDHSEILEVVYIDTQTGKRVESEKLEDSHLNFQMVEAVGPISREPIPMHMIPPVPSSPIATVSNANNSIMNNSNGSHPIKTNNAPVQNTLIIREVPSGIEESHIRELFTFDSCPPISSLHLDVANCWFVTLDTTSKDDMFNVMFELRAKRFPSGEPVMARLKSGVAMNSDASPVAYQYITHADPMIYAPQLHSIPPTAPVASKKNSLPVTGKKKKNNTSNGASGHKPKAMNGGAAGAPRGNKGKNGNAQRRNSNKSAGGATRKGSSQRQGDARLLQQAKLYASPQIPPSLGEDQFPSLGPGDDQLLSKKKVVEVETVPEGREEEDKLRGSSDSGSTATSSSASSESKPTTESQRQGVVQPQLPMGGYAAALLKAAPPAPKPKTVAPEKSTKSAEGPANNSSNKNNNKKDKNSKNGHQNHSSNDSKKSEKKITVTQKVEPKVIPNNAKEQTSATKVSSWHGGRSFADVLRKETAASVAAGTEQSA